MAFTPYERQLKFTWDLVVEAYDSEKGILSVRRGQFFFDELPSSEAGIEEPIQLPEGESPDNYQEIEDGLPREYNRLQAGQVLPLLGGGTMELASNFWLHKITQTALTWPESELNKGLLQDTLLEYRQKLPTKDEIPDIWGQIADVGLTSLSELHLEALANVSEAWKAFYLFQLLIGLGGTEMLAYHYNNQTTVTIQPGNQRAADGNYTFLVETEIHVPLSSPVARTKYFLYAKVENDLDVYFFSDSGNPGGEHLTRLREYIVTDEFANILEFSPPLPYGIPTGIVVQWLGSLAPLGWLLCDGGHVARNLYDELYDVIDNNFVQPLAFTVNISTDEVTCVGHNFHVGELLKISSTGTLPAPCDPEHFLKVLTVNNDIFTVDLWRYDSELQVYYLDQGGDFTDMGSGVHTCWKNPDTEGFPLPDIEYGIVKF